MTQNLVRRDDPQEQPWGKANPQRGRNYVETAMAFAEAFPIGTIMSVEKFDQWTHDSGLVEIPADTAKQSDAWLAHLQRRHQLRYNINKASTHPRMSDQGAAPFTIDTIGPGKLEVRAVHTAIHKNALARKISSVVETKRKQLEYLLQSADFDALPSHERTVAESLHDDIRMFERRVNLDADGLGDKFARLAAKIRHAIESGTVRHTNGGMRALTDGLEPEEDDEE